MGAALSALFSTLFFFPYFSFKSIVIIGSVFFLISAGIIFFSKHLYISTKKKLEKEKKFNEPFYLSLISFFLVGIATIGFEVLWTRQFSVAFGSSVYTFSFILFTYLLGLFVGSFLFSHLGKKSDNSLNKFMNSILSALVFIFITFPLWDEIPLFQIEFLKLFGVNFYNFHIANIIACFFFIFIPTLFFGYSYPAFLSFFAQENQNISIRAGVCIGLNGIGNVIGSLLTPIFLLPILGVNKSLLFLNGLLIISIIFLSIIYNTKKLFAIILLSALSLLISLIPWNNEKWFTGLSKAPYQVVEGAKREGIDKLFLTQELLEIQEDREISIGIIKKYNGSIVLMIQGKPDASNSQLDKFTESLIGVIGYFYNPKAKDVYCLGFGSGITSNSILRKKDVKLVTTEISPKVVKLAKKYFSLDNSLCWDSDRHKIIIGDGRKVLRKYPNKFDIIISEPSNPWVSGMSSLFTLEFFNEVKNKLNENGIFVQWFHLYGMSLKSFGSFSKTFLSVFPDADVYILPLQGDIILIASTKEVKLSFLTVQDFGEELKTLFNDLNIYDSLSLYSLYYGRLSSIENQFESSQLISDLFPYLEYHTPKDLFEYRFSSTLEKFITPNTEKDFELEFSNIPFYIITPDPTIKRIITTSYFPNKTSTAFLRQIYKDYEIWTSLNDQNLSKEEGNDLLKYFYRNMNYIKIIPIIWQNQNEKAVLGKRDNEVYGYFYIKDDKNKKSHFLIARCKENCEYNYQFLINIIQNLKIP